MLITSIQMYRRVNSGTRLVATPSIVLDDLLVIHDIKVIERIDGLFLGMPSRSTNVGTFSDIVHPITREAREIFENLMFAAYQATVEKDLVRAEYVYTPQEGVGLFDQTFDMFHLVTQDGRNESTSKKQSFSDPNRNVKDEKNKREAELLKWLES